MYCTNRIPAYSGSAFISSAHTHQGYVFHPVCKQDHKQKLVDNFMCNFGKRNNQLHLEGGWNLEIFLLFVTVLRDYSLVHLCWTIYEFASF